MAKTTTSIRVFPAQKKMLETTKEAFILHQRKITSTVIDSLEKYLKHIFLFTQWTKIKAKKVKISLKLMPKAHF